MDHRGGPEVKRAEQSGSIYEANREGQNGYGLMLTELADPPVG